MKDFIQLPDTVHNYATYSGVTAGDGTETIDGDFDTFWKAHAGRSGSCSMKSQHEFSSVRTLKRIVFKFNYVTSSTAGDPANTSGGGATVYIYRDGAWELIFSKTDSTSGSQTKTSGIPTEVIETTYEGVEQIYGYLYGSNSNAGGEGDGYNDCWFYEIQAYGDSLDYATII